MAECGHWKRIVTKIAASLWVAAAVYLFPGTANAVPSYARQTGLACEACHTVFPQLTPFGRTFKASGYTLFNTLKVEDINREKQSTLSLSDLPPVSMMVVASTSQAAKANDPNSSKSSTDFPQQLSIFYAGHISDNVGAYIQVTYDDQSGTIGMDNTDIRFADVAKFDGHNVIYGLSLNNNPTVQDLWNSTPAWSQPFFTSPALAEPGRRSRKSRAPWRRRSPAFPPTPISINHLCRGGCLPLRAPGRLGRAKRQREQQRHLRCCALLAARLRGRLGQQFLGGRNFRACGQSRKSDYARRQRNQRLVATWTDRPLSRCRPGQPIPIHRRRHATDRHRTLDPRKSESERQFQLRSRRMRTIRATTSTPRALSEAISGTANWAQHWACSASWDRDDATYFGTASGKPDSTWGNVEVDYLPWLNVKLGLQYTAFFKFNGATTNYDGAGRNASDNNLLYAYLWLAF